MGLLLSSRKVVPPRESWDALYIGFECPQGVESAAGRQCEPPSLAVPGLWMLCCSCTEGAEPVLLFQVRRVRGTARGSVLGLS